MHKLGFLKCEVQLCLLDENQINQKRRMLKRMANDKGIRICFLLNCSQLNIIQIQIVETIRREEYNNIGSLIFEYLLSVIQFEWLEEITLLSKHQESLKQYSTKFNKSTVPTPTIVFPSIANFSTRLNLFKHVFYSQLVQKINNGDESSISNSAEAPLERVVAEDDDDINPDDSASNNFKDETYQINSTLAKYQSCKRLKGFIELSSLKLDRSNVKRWTKEQIKELLLDDEIGLCLSQDIVNSIDIDGYDLDAVIRKMEIFEGNEQSCTEYFCNKPERTLTLSHLDNRIRIKLILWLRNNMLLFK